MAIINCQLLSEFAIAIRTYMMGKVSLHDDHKVSCCELKSIDVRISVTWLPRRRYENIAISSIKGDQLVCNFLGAISRGFVDGNEVSAWLAIVPIVRNQIKIAK